MTTFKILLALCISSGLLATTLGGLDKVGLALPGKAVGFEAAPHHAAHPCVRLTSDAGDLTCWIRLRIRGADPKTQQFTARLDSGKSLATEWHDEWLHIRMDAPKEGDHKFLWHSGVPVDVELTTGALDQIVVEDWEVHLKDGPHESMTLRKWRRIIQVVVIVCAVLGLFYATFEGVKKVIGDPARGPVIAPRDCVVAIINDVQANENENDPDTQIYRQFLTAVVLGLRSAREVIDSLLPNASPSRRARVRAGAWAAFNRRFQIFIDELTRLRGLSSGTGTGAP
jgi:hypothetical protein